MKHDVGLGLAFDTVPIFTS